jgi:hypothetical protein
VFVVVVERFNERGGIKVTENVEKVIKSLKIRYKKVDIFQWGAEKRRGWHLSFWVRIGKG